MVFLKKSGDVVANQEEDRVRICDNPIAPKGFISYRYNRGHGYIMISAISPEDALSQVKWMIKKEPMIENLEVWSGNRYMPQRVFDNLGFNHDPKYMNDKRRLILF